MYSRYCLRRLKIQETEVLTLLDGVPNITPYARLGKFTTYVSNQEVILIYTQSLLITTVTSVINQETGVEEEYW